jgi:hypothetical protein
LWELPLDRALQYQHCALRAAGVWTVPPGTTKKKILAGEADFNALAETALKLAEIDADEWA